MSDLRHKGNNWRRGSHTGNDRPPGGSSAGDDGKLPVGSRRSHNEDRERGSLRSGASSKKTKGSRAAPRGRGRGLGSHDKNSDSRDGDIGRGHSRGARGSFRSAQGKRGAGSDTKLENFGFRNLQSMAENDADKLVLDMTTERCLPATENLVNSAVMDDRKIVLVLKVLDKACRCRTTRISLQKLLGKLPQSTYLSSHLSNYINRLPYASHLDVKEKQSQLTSVLKILEKVFSMLPNSFADLPIPQLEFAAMTLESNDELIDQDILSGIKSLSLEKNEMAKKIQHENEQRAIGPKRRNRGDEAALLDDEDPPNDFRLLSVVPTQQDVRALGRPFVRRNKVDGSYNSPEHYLDVQFRLLREDFVGPLRNGINDLLSKLGSAKIGPLQDIRVYHGVRILNPTFSNKGLNQNIRFDVSKLSRVRWENSKRLIYGSLLCLSKDNFETIILATVENRDLKELEKGMIEVCFAGTSQMQDMFSKTTYEMVETTAYFESYRHVLQGLKEIDPDTIPFKLKM